jgi:hypothetical protein
VRIHAAFLFMAVLNGIACIATLVFLKEMPRKISAVENASMTAVALLPSTGIFRTLLAAYLSVTLAQAFGIPGSIADWLGLESVFYSAAFCMLFGLTFFTLMVRRSPASPVPAQAAA